MDGFGIDDLSQSFGVTDRGDAQEVGFSGTAQCLERGNDFVTNLRKSGSLPNEPPEQTVYELSQNLLTSTCATGASVTTAPSQVRQAYPGRRVTRTRNCAGRMSSCSLPPSLKNSRPGHSPSLPNVAAALAGLGASPSSSPVAIRVTFAALRSRRRRASRLGGLGANRLCS